MIQMMMKTSLMKTKLTTTGETGRITNFMGNTKRRYKNEPEERDIRFAFTFIHSFIH
jgi:hypothetical protein